MAAKINEYYPDWLYIQPFVLNQLIRAYIRLGIEPANSIRYIESVGEILTSDLRSRAEELFHIKITNMYGSEEMNGIAIENPNAEMHVFTENVFLEVTSITMEETNAPVQALTLPSLASFTPVMSTI